MDFKKDYYQILGVPRQATDEQIKKAYRFLAKKYHPDLHPGNTEYEEKIKAVNEAYEVLGNGDNRFVYDHYKEPEPVAEPAKPKAPTKNQRSHTRKETITHEEKIYVKGTIYIKYRGKQNEKETGDVLKEVVYNLQITDTRTVIDAKDIYREALTPKSYHDAIAKSKTELHVAQPVKTTVRDGAAESHYELEIFDLAIVDLVYDNVTKDDGDSFGSMHGTFYGYIKHTTTEEKETIVTECYGETGKKETKTENGTTYRRKQYYQNDCSTYWGNWIPDYAPPAPRKTTVVQSAGCLPSLFSILQWFYVGIFLIYFLANLYFLIPFLLIAGLFWLISAGLWVWLFRGLGMLMLGLFIFSLIGAFNRPQVAVLVIKDQPRESHPRRTVSQHDSLLTYYRNWKDYDGNTYDGLYTIRNSAFLRAKNYKNNLEAGYDEMLYDLYAHDQNQFNGLYHLLDSIKTAHHLQPQPFADVIVSMVQDIPYAVVLPEACDANLYADQFINKYLASADAQCDGYEKFGINTPVEFLATLKGDCDTRTLLLYTILAHYAYDVALLSSCYYSHSLIGINLPYDGVTYEKYTLWETTSFFKPGILPNEILRSQLLAHILKIKTMNPLKTITLTLAAIIAIAMMLTVIQRLLRKLPSETDSRIKPAYGVWFGSLFIPACLITAKAVSFLAEAVDNVYKLGISNLFFELVKISALYIGLSVLWLLLWHYIAKVISVIIFGLRHETEEMELNNTYYFLIRGLLVIGFVFCLGPVLDSLFRVVMPNVSLPFYH